VSLLFIHNQHSVLNQDFYLSLAGKLYLKKNFSSVFLFWKNSEINHIFKSNKINAFSFEKFYKDYNKQKKNSIEQFINKYPQINWSQIISSERSFSDYSMLLGASGNRKESFEYIQNLIINITEFLSLHMKNKKAIICQTSDTLISYIAIKLAQHYCIKAFIINPCLFYEDKMGAGFYANDEYLHSNLMIKKYNELNNYKFTKKDLLRIDHIKNRILDFKNKDDLIKKNKGSNPGINAITPKFDTIFSYIIKNLKEDKNIFYTKIDPLKKIKANILRLYRKKINKYLRVYGEKNIKNIPKKNIFFAMHFQPEQSTLTQGNWYLNQVALIENISKSLPLNYTLIVKEHPWGRGTRPTWQYKYISNFHNVLFCDAPSKDIIKQTQAVLTISGSIVFEAMVLDKPIIMFGDNFFDFSKLIYKVENVKDLPVIFNTVLIKKNLLSKNKRNNELNKFILSYIRSLITGFPITENVVFWADALIDELK
tara:strand:+ start:327 stop:1772 length:1446 start_codon:yes stop_codon:yes gene_type:complete